jgi:hypothetical protein
LLGNAEAGFDLLKAAEMEYVHVNAYVDDEAVLADEG